MADIHEAGVAQLAQRLGIGIFEAELGVITAMVRDQIGRAEPFGAGMPRRASATSDADALRTDRPFDAHPDDAYRAFLTTCRIDGRADGPLAGTTVSLKDHIAVAGLPLTLGSAMLRSHIATQDATVVTRLLDAGASIVGKNNLSAFSLGDISYLGKPINPVAPDREPGGSSSGSAVAVAAGLVDAAIGGDQGGSIRIPAAWCGVIGLKPTYGLVPHTGVVSGNDPLLDHLGPIARTVLDAARFLAAIGGVDGNDLRQVGVPRVDDPQRLLGRGVDGLRIGVLTEGFTDATDPAVDDAVRSTIERLRGAGAIVSTVSVAVHHEVQAPYFCCALEGTFRAWQANLATDPVRAELPESVIAAFAGTGWASADLRAPLLYRTNVLAGALIAEQHGGRLLAHAHNARPRFAAQYDRALADLDALVMPTIPVPPPLLDAPVVAGADPLVRVLNTLPFDFTGHPALTVPCGPRRELPVGLQLVGRPFDEATLFRIAEVVEADRPR